MLLCAAMLLSPAQQSAFAQSTETAPRSGVLQNDLSKARQLSSQSNWPALQAHAWQWAHRDPSEWRAWRFLGEAERKLGRLSEAVAAFTRAEENRPPVRGRKDDSLLIAVADLQAENGQLLDAENSYLLAFEANEKNTDTWRKLTDLRVRLAETDPLRRKIAADSLERLMTHRRFINDHARWRKYAELRDALGEDDKARGAYVHALRLKPADGPAWERVVLYDLAAGRRESALSGMRTLLRVDPSNVIANAYLGEKALEEGLVDEARERFERVAAAQAGDVEARSTAYKRLIELAETRAERIRLNSAALRVNPALWDSWDYLIVQRRGAGDRKGAAELHRRKRRAQLLLEEGEPVPPALLP